MIKDELWNTKASHILVTSNSYIRKDGALVMGRGAALEAATRFPNFPYIAGGRISEKWGGHLGFYGTLLSVHKNIGLFQVKRHFKDPAELGIIEASVGSLLVQMRNETYAINFPGIGYGQLEISRVLPVIQKLPDNVWIYHKVDVIAVDEIQDMPEDTLKLGRKG